MLLSDSQKYYTLKYKKGLISDGMMKYTRNPNYLGEIMLYGAFVILVNDFISYVCVMQVWFIVFSMRIH
jgi:protein-S-isoprenylcysteine O-methyltransferase Ste14